MGASGAELRAERERAGLSREALARFADVSAKTVERIEAAPNARPRDVTMFRDALAAAVAERKGEPRSAEEMNYIVAEVRRKAMHYNVRAAQGAPEAELRHLRSELEFSIRVGLKAGGREPAALDYITEAFFDLMTLESRAPLGEQPVAKRPRDAERKAQTPRKRKNG